MLNGHRTHTVATATEPANLYELLRAPGSRADAGAYNNPADEEAGDPVEGLRRRGVSARVAREGVFSRWTRARARAHTEAWSS